MLRNVVVRSRGVASLIPRTTARISVRRSSTHNHQPPPELPPDDPAIAKTVSSPASASVHALRNPGPDHYHYLYKDPEDPHHHHAAGKHEEHEEHEHEGKIIHEHDHHTVDLSDAPYGHLFGEVKN
jgi:hypothetical protein